jgi:uncharacterized protein
MSNNKEIESFFEGGDIAVVGLSRNNKKFANVAYRELKNKGYTVYALGKNLTLIDEDPVYQSFNEISGKISSAVIIVKPENTLSIIKEALEAGVKNIWLQQGAESREAIEYCSDKDVNLIIKQCILMYAKPDGVHKLHWWIDKTFKRIFA